ncbi:MAG: hypothetical protein WDO73_37845 [Ignavibacteriota bacterium]
MRWGPRYAALAGNRYALLAVATGRDLDRSRHQYAWRRLWEMDGEHRRTACLLLGVALVVLAVLVGAKRGSATPIHVLPTWNLGHRQLLVEHRLWDSRESRWRP